MSNTSKSTLQKQREALRKSDEEAFKALQAFEDAIFEAEDREARRGER